MEKSNGRKWTIAAFLLVFVSIVGLTVAFASLSQNLEISPIATVKKGNWRVRFANLTMTEKKGKTKLNGTAQLSDDSTKITGINIELSEPGDSVTYKFDVVNEGTIDAKIGDITIGRPDCVGKSLDGNATADAELVCGNLTYTLVYSVGDPKVGLEPAEGDILNNRDLTDHTRNLTLTIVYDGTDVPTDDVEIKDLEIAFTYIQK